MIEPTWETLVADTPDLFLRLRRYQGCEILVRYAVGERQGIQVEVPAARTTLQGRLEVHPQVDRFRIRLEGWSEEDFIWLARRKGRGGPGYWQGAIEYRPEGKPALVHYFTAPLDGLVIKLRPTRSNTDHPGHCEEE